jgi:hypothetical protein
MANASVTVTGTPDAPIFNFDIPQGEKGDVGGIVLGSLLTSIHLDTILISGVYRQDDGSKAGPALGYPYSNSGGILLVFERIVTTSVQQEWHPHTRPELIFTRTYSSGTWTAWKAHASTRVDTTAGRVFYQWDNVNDREQLVYGDTGRRNMNSLILNVGAGSVILSRYGTMVTLLFADFQDTTVGSTVSWPNLIPVGFRPANWIYMPIPSGRTVTIQNAGQVSSNNHSSTVYQGSLSWRTDEAWPTTLPGTAVGSIPNI